MSASLSDWLAKLEGQGPAPIALGLDRVAAVYLRLRQHADAVDGNPALVFTVAGTNGKGSTVCFIDAILRAAGLRVGRYTSPHLLDYNERIVIDGRPAPDQSIVEAFARIERLRGEIELTYFEFGTLAALELFADARLDAWVLEVGLGGRLDAVNIVDPDVAIVTSVDLDHQSYLGSDRESIGFEKAGVFRSGRPAIIAERDPPVSLLGHAKAIGADVLRRDVDFTIETDEVGVVSWRAPDQSRVAMPKLALAGAHQSDNAAAALAALWSVRKRWPWSLTALSDGLSAANLPGRLQRLPGNRALYLDVAHNPHGARALAEWLCKLEHQGAVHAVFGLLADKDLEGVIGPLLERIDYWHLADLTGPRGRPAQEIAAALRDHGCCQMSIYPSVGMALDKALAVAEPADLIIAFGSFLVAEQVLASFQPSLPSAPV